MIPKKIHYCWFGGNPLGEKEIKCIESWKKFCPDYEIIQWNESNFDVSYIPFTKEAYEAKKYAFVSDVARLKIIYEHGGLYLDTDVEVVKSFDNLLDSEIFLGFENKEYINTGQGFGSEKGNDFVKENLDVYSSLRFLNEDGTFNMIGCPKITTKLLLNRGLIQNGLYQNLDGIEIFPTEYFNPYNYVVDKLYKTENTYSIHWYSNSWGNKRNPILNLLIKYYHRFLKAIGKI